MCWYCGCHTSIVKREAPIAAYVAALRCEIELITDRLDHRLKVGHVHFGGSTPTILAADLMVDLIGALRHSFFVLPDAELAIEIDPRTLVRGMATALGHCGVSLVTEFGKWLIEWTDPVSRLMHYVLYGLLVLVPLLGIALQFAEGNSLPLFGLTKIPSPWLADKAFAHTLKDVHGVLANVLVVLAGVHMIAALLHHIVFGDATLRRMLPRRNQRRN